MGNLCTTAQPGDAEEAASEPADAVSNFQHASLGAAASTCNPLHRLPLRLLQSLEHSKGIVIQASGRVIRTRPGVALSALEEDMLRDLAALVREGHGLRGGLLCDEEEEGGRAPLQAPCGGGAAAEAALEEPALLQEAAAEREAALALEMAQQNADTAIVSPPGGAGAAPGDAAPAAAPAAAAAASRPPLPSPQQLLQVEEEEEEEEEAAALAASPSASIPAPLICSPRYLPAAGGAAPPRMPANHPSRCIPCNASVCEGGQVYYLDGPGGPALAPGWQRFACPIDDDDDAAAAAADATTPLTPVLTEVFYACVVPRQLTHAPPRPAYDPPYAELPPLSVLPPFHPRINPRDRSAVVGSGSGGSGRGVRLYEDPRSGELLAAGWRAVTDGRVVWYSSRAVKGSRWHAPLHEP